MSRREINSGKESGSLERMTGSCPGESWYVRMELRLLQVELMAVAMERAWERRCLWLERVREGGRVKFSEEGEGLMRRGRQGRAVEALELRRDWRRRETGRQAWQADWMLEARLVRARRWGAVDGLAFLWMMQRRAESVGMDSELVRTEGFTVPVESLVMEA